MDIKSLRKHIQDRIQEISRPPFAADNPLNQGKISAFQEILEMLNIQEESTKRNQFVKNAL